MKAMIFAAGLGTRLKPITDTLPKALVPVCGQPLLYHVARKLQASGINDAVVNVHYFADQIEHWLSEQDWIVSSPQLPSDNVMRIDVSDERAMLLETGGAVLHARRLLEGCGSFLIHNVDILSDCDLNWLKSQVKPDAIATLLVSNRATSRYMLFHPDTMRLVGWTNRSTGETIMTFNDIRPEDCKALAFSGIHILSDKVFALMDEYVKDQQLPVSPSGVKFSITTGFYLWASSRVPIYGVEPDSLKFVDVGKIETLTLAEEFLKGQE